MMGPVALGESCERGKTTQVVPLPGNPLLLRRGLPGQIDGLEGAELYSQGECVYWLASNQGGETGADSCYLATLHPKT